SGLSASVTVNKQTAVAEIASVIVQTVPSKNVYAYNGGTTAVDLTGGEFLVKYTNPVIFPDATISMTDAGVTLGSSAIDTSKAAGAAVPVTVTYGGFSCVFYVTALPNGAGTVLTFDGNLQGVKQPGASADDHLMAVTLASDGSDADTTNFAYAPLNGEGVLQVNISNDAPLVTNGWGSSVKISVPTDAASVAGYKTATNIKFDILVPVANIPDPTVLYSDWEPQLCMVTNEVGWYAGGITGSYVKETIGGVDFYRVTILYTADDDGLALLSKVVTNDAFTVFLTVSGLANTPVYFDNLVFYNANAATTDEFHVQSFSPMRMMGN
ncbi:MAG: hypothetical protein FWF44_06915, partial [Defluviitaleaceae bacterium]|nr:hypothetical protein [Defluviitaleaceae bacterium]